MGLEIYGLTKIVPAGSDSYFLIIVKVIRIYDEIVKKVIIKFDQPTLQGISSISSFFLCGSISTKTFCFSLQQIPGTILHFGIIITAVIVIVILNKQTNDERHPKFVKIGISAICPCRFFTRLQE
jgi:hypothetical protein